MINRINILDSAVFNRIAAGEVVERPAGVIKELVENSIDAKADVVTVEIKNGGIELIKVTDNGSGIHRDQMVTAFMPHATSKINALSDLDGIATLGFRGEALPSIASVAKVTMISRPIGEELGYYVKFEKGKLIGEGECGASFGTSVTVENIFSFIPARQKFLSKPNQEEAKITELMQKLILANPSVALKYNIGGKSVLYSSGGGAESAVFSVYGRETLSNLYAIDGNMPGIILKGYVSKPEFTKFSRGFQTLIVNGRYVENAEISHYVYGCYSEYLMKRQFPMYVLYLDIPYDMVDVNIHPNKMEIKFIDTAAVKRLLGGCIKEVLRNSIYGARDIVSRQDEVGSKIGGARDRINIPYDVFSEPKDGTKNLSDVRDEKSRAITSESLDVLHVSVKSRYEGECRGAETTLKESPLSFSRILSELSENRRDKNADCESAATVSEGLRQETDFEQTALNMRYEFRIAGKLFDTYILIEYKGSSYFIDQHAAHERLIYDKLKKGYEEGGLAVQNMLAPYVFTVTPAEACLIRENIEIISKCGFLMQEFGGQSFSLSSVPVMCERIKLDDFVSLMLEKLQSKKLKTLDFITESIMQSACKAAVKGEDDLSKSEIDSLLQAMMLSDMVLLCPHGRPVAVKLSKSEVEKWFKRIV